MLKKLLRIGIAAALVDSVVAGTQDYLHSPEWKESRESLRSELQERTPLLFSDSEEELPTVYLSDIDTTLTVTKKGLLKDKTYEIKIANAGKHDHR